MEVEVDMPVVEVGKLVVEVDILVADVGIVVVVHGGTGSDSLNGHSRQSGVGTSVKYSK